MKKTEKLHPDLQTYLEERGPLGRMIRHPLLYEIVYMPQMNAVLNARYLAKKKATTEAFDKKDWSHYIILYERPYRLVPFMNSMKLMTDQEYWHNLGRVWSDSENIWQNIKVWKKLMAS